MTNTTQFAHQTQQNPPDSAASREWLAFIQEDAVEAKERGKPSAASVFYAWLRYSKKSELGLSVRAVLGSVHSGTTCEELSAAHLDVLDALYEAIQDTGRTRPNTATDALINGAIDRLPESARYWCYPVGVAAFRENTAAADPAVTKAEDKADRKELARHWKRQDRIAAEFRHGLKTDIEGADTLAFMERAALRALYFSIRHGGEPERELRELRADYPKLDSRITERVALAACRSNRTEGEDMKTDTLTPEMAEFMAKLEGDTDTDTAQEDGAAKAVLIDPREVKAEAIQWLVEDAIAKRTFHLVCGPTEVGKTSLLLDYAASASAGREPFTRSHRVLLACLEGSLRYTHLPQLKASGADLGNIRFIHTKQIAGRELPFMLEYDLNLMTDAALRWGGVDLIVLDPVIRTAGGARDSYNPNDMRTALAPLDDLVKRTGAAVMGISHLKKGAEGNIKRGEAFRDQRQGSSVWDQYARIHWTLWKQGDAGKRQFIYGATGNLIPPWGAWIREGEIISSKENKRVPVIEHGDNRTGDIEAHIADALETGPERTTAADRAAVWIRQRLPVNGAAEKQAIIRAEVEDGGKAFGFGWDTLRRIDLKRLGIIKKQHEYGGESVWQCTGLNAELWDESGE